MKVSVIITAFKEEATIGKAIECICDPNYSGIPKDFELILACPDEGSHLAAQRKVIEMGIEDKYIWIQDPGKIEGKGKPTGLNLAINKAKGDILIFTDGDVYFEEFAVKELIAPFESNSDEEGVNNIQLVTGRPRSGDSKNAMMGYFGHLLADAAHHKRTIELTESPEGKGTLFVKKVGFFPVSGYIYALRREFISKLPKFKESSERYGTFEGIFPEHTLVDDAYISYVVHNSGGLIGYAPEAIAYVKYPTNLKDYFKQKKRSTGGYVQLWEYGVVESKTKTRSLKKELEYFWFPFKYASNIKEFFYSLMLYPIRLWLWIMIFWERRVTKKDFVKTWVRVESTK